MQIAPSDEETKKLKAYVELPDKSVADLSTPEQFLHLIGQVMPIAFMLHIVDAYGQCKGRALQVLPPPCCSRRPTPRPTKGHNETCMMQLACLCINT